MTFFKLKLFFISFLCIIGTKTMSGNIFDTCTKLSDESSVSSESCNLTTSIYPSNAANQELEQTSSSDESILKATRNGETTTAGGEQATETSIIKESANTTSSSRFTTTPPLASSISFSSKSVIVFAGFSTELTVNISPENADTDFSLSVAKVDNNPTDIITYSKADDNKVIIKGLYKGAVKLIAKTTDGSNISAYCIVNVYNISFQENHIVLGQDQTFKLIPTISPSLDQEVYFNWKSSNTKVASISPNGLVTAKSSGASAITCSPVGFDGVSISCDVEVGTLYDKNLLVETFVSTQELYTVRGYAGIEMYKSLAIENNSNIKAIPIAVHTNFVEADPMTIPEYSSGISNLTHGIPTFVYDRNRLAESPTSANRTMFYPDEAKRLMAQKSVFGLEISSVKCPENTYNDKQLSVEVCINPGRNSSETYRLAAVIVENNVTNIASQNNNLYYTYTSDQVDTYDWQWMAPYCANGIYGQKIIPASTMVYQNVARGIFPSFDGKDIGSNWIEGTCHPATISFNLPENIQHIENCELVVILIDRKGRVVNSASMPYSQFNRQPPTITGLSINKSSLALEYGKSERLVATVTPTYIDKPAIKWTSTNPTVAVVIDGLVTATGVGTTTVTVSTTDGSRLSQSCEVSVYPSSISFNESEITLFEHETFQLIPNVPEEYLRDATILWSSSNNEVINVDQTGLVTAKSKGQAKAILTIWTPSATIKAECYVTINRIATDIAISQNDTTINIDDNIQLYATLQPADVYTTEVKWTSLNENVATVDSYGKVHGRSQGTTVIVASTTDGSNLSASCNITVNQLVSDITLNITNTTLSRGQNIQLIATVLPEFADNKSLVWTSSNEAVATVDQSGLVMAVGKGTALIKACSTDGSNISADCSVTVICPITSIILSETEVEMSAGEYHILTATYIPEDATDNTLIWTSSDTNVTRVENGIVIAISDGEAIITVSTNDDSGISASCNVLVRTLVSEIILSEDTISLKEGEFKELTAAILPDNATNTKIEWTSSDESIITVHNGTVLAHKKGTAIITAAATDSSGAYAECIAEVTDNSSIDNINNDGVYITIEPLIATVHGTDEDTLIYLFNLDGKALYIGNNPRVKVDQPGIYILVINNKTYKIEL